MAAQKKHSSTRQRRNRATSAAHLTVPSDPTAPDLPERADEWHTMVVDYWTRVWASPMASEFVDADLSRLFLIAELHQEFWTAEKPSGRIAAAKEIRLQEVKFGLTPYDRRSLEWTIDQGEAASARTRKRRNESVTRPAEDPGDDPRAALA